MATLLPGLESDGESPPLVPDEESSDDESDGVDESFEFGGVLGEDGNFMVNRRGNAWSYQSAIDQTAEQKLPRMDVASLIRAKREALHKTRVSSSSASDGSNSDGSDSSSSDDDSSSSSDDDNSHDDLEEDVLKNRTGPSPAAQQEEDQSQEDESDEDDEEEAAKAAAFFDKEQSQSSMDVELFTELSLSRPILRGITSMGFTRPTPIQAAVIPLALRGRDICASAVTGSGKTAAFGLPLLERLLGRSYGSTRAIILTPTRELAAQCLGMLTSLAQFTKLRVCLIVGGSKNIPAQASELRTRPELIVATPGRLLDHITNSAGVELEYVECLVLDEADRLLDLGFQEEVHEIVKACPAQRQTMLFSATMNTKVDDLIQLSMKRPVRVKITDKTKDGDIEVAPRLEQEFVRVRAGNEGVNREGMLLALLSRTYPKQTIVFFDTKVTAHRLMILCGLCGIKCAELHGNLSQQQRLTALEEFRTGAVDILLATDLAARGLDIDSVKAVVNFEMPNQVATYIHRIGRTARAGRGGRSCTLIGEGRRHLMKDIIKDAEAKTKKDASSASKKSGVIRSRTIPPAVVTHFVGKIAGLESHVEEVLQAEAVARMDRVAEMEVVKAQNLIEHAGEIGSRPQREWFASKQQKKMTKEQVAEKQRMIAEKVGTGTHRMTRKKRRAREALAALNAPDSSGDEQQAPRQEVKSMKATVRGKKREQEVKEQAHYERSIHDIDEEKKAHAKKKKKMAKGQDAIGDSSIFDDEQMHTKAPSKTEPRRPPSNYRFEDFDPNKKFGKKRGNKAFKSKSKYKRRK